MSILKADFSSPNFRFREWYQGCKGKLEGNSTVSTEDVLAGMEAVGEWFAEPKRDGIWCVAFFDERGVEFYSRTQELKPYSLSSMVIPELFGCALVGELGFGSQESKRRREELGRDFMDVFDVIVARYEDFRGYAGSFRRTWLEKEWTDYRPKGIPALSPLTRHHFLLNPRWTSGFVDRYRAEPEGLILKPKSEGAYLGGGQKVKHWIKVKKDHTVDMIVMGYELSTAETKAGKGMVEHLVCGAYVDGELKELTKTGGMTHEMQLDIVANWETYKGRVVELKHFGQFKSGALRHPSVVRFRDDKRPTDCTFDPETISLNSFKSV